MDTQALWPHRIHQDKLRKKYDNEYPHYLHSLEAFEAAKKQALSSKKKTYEEKKQAINNLPDPPQPPLSPLLLVEEPTYEGLIKLLAVGQPSIGLFSDEGGRFIGGHGMSKDNLLKTASGMSSLWDGKPVTRVRAGDGSTLLCGRRLSIHLMAQPSVAQLILSNGMLLEQGFISRCLICYPNSRVGKRAYKEANLSSNSAMKAYIERILSILSSAMPLSGGKLNELQPRHLPLTAESKALWIDYYNSIERQIADGGELASIRGLGNKAPEHALRLAAIIALIDNLSCASIDPTYMKAGIVLMNYYLREANRLHSVGLSDPDLLLADKLLHWLQGNRSKHISLPEIYQKGPRPIRSAKQARTLMEILNHTVG